MKPKPKKPAGSMLKFEKPSVPGKVPIVEGLGKGGLADDNQVLT